jgi:8-oxo-dGTP diphosphatase
MESKKLIRVVAAEIELNGRFLITQRREHALFPLYWEFPSGKVEQGESDQEALTREIKERLGVQIQVGSCTMYVKHEYDDYTLDFYVYQCGLSSTTSPRPLLVKDWKWVSTQEMEHYPFPPADAYTIQKLLTKDS